MKKSVIRALYKNPSKLHRKSIFKPSKFLANLLIKRSIKCNEEVYFNVQVKNNEFYSQGSKKLCKLDNQYYECSCEECRK